MDHDSATVVVSSSSETMDVLAGVLRFGKSLRNHKGILISYLLIAGIVGAVYFVVADRVYKSEGELMVLPTGADVMDTNTGKPHMIDRDMPTYERMVMSDPVIRATLRALPPEHRCDLARVEPGEWEKAFRHHLTVSTARDTNIMTVEYRSCDPETAYAVLSTLFTKYVAYVNGIYERDSDDRLDLLRGEQSALEQMIIDSKQEYFALLNETPLLLGGEDEQTNVYAEGVKKLHTELLEAGSQRREAEIQFSALQEAIANGEDLQQFYLEMAENVGTELFMKQMGVSNVEGYSVRQLQDDILEDRTKLQTMKENYGYGPNHPAVLEIENRIAAKVEEMHELPARVKEAADAVTQLELAPKLLRMAQQRYEIAAQNERQIEQQYDAESRRAKHLNAQLVAVRQVKKDLELLHTKRDEFLTTMRKILLDQEHGLFTEVTRDPQIVRTPVAPRLPLVAVVSVFLGFTAACATVYVLNLLDDRFHSPDELRTQVGAPILAMVHRLSPLGEHGLESLHTFSRPNAPESEAFRTLRAALDFTGGGARRLTISSTEPSDGKTTVISNLSVAFAQSGKRTLVIDGDMRRPGLTRVFNRGGHPGLSTILRDTRPIAESVQSVVVETGMINLHVLSAGPRPGNPVELLTSDRLSDLIAWAETQYDQILIDAPPSLAVTDAAIIGRLVDGAILTVRPDKNRRTLVLRASEALTSLGCELLGVVVNSVEPGTSKEYGYAYGYGHGNYGHGEHDDETPPVETPPAAAPPKTPDTGSTIGIYRERSTRRSSRRRAA